MLDLLKPLSPKGLKGGGGYSNPVGMVKRNIYYFGGINSGVNGDQANIDELGAITKIS
jgi:hypothetical protein